MNTQIERRDFLKAIGFGAASLSFASFLNVISCQKKIGMPNIVFIMADDMGYGDVGCYGAAKIKTPHIDRLAGEGIRFTDAHTPSAVCTPTRYGVLTGRYCWRTRLKKGVLWSGYDRLLIDPERMTVASILKSKGYVTAAVGKWHLGYGTRENKTNRGEMHDAKSGTDYSRRLEPGPLKLGFDYTFQVPASHDMAPYCFVENGYVVGELTEEKHPSHFQQRKGLMTRGWKDEEIGTTLTRKAVSFIENHAKNNNDRPFFLYFTPVAPHRPNVVADFMKGKSEAGVRGDHVQEFDWSVGEVLKTINHLGLKENTLVIVTSDNGAKPVGRDGLKEGKVVNMFGHKSCGDLRGYKAQIWDGGHRVPFIARWHGKIEPGSTSNEIICLTDFFATCAAIVGLELPDNAGEDSYNILPVLLGKKPDKPIREAVVHHDVNGNFSIRQEPWKLILLDPEASELYNMDEDFGEQRMNEQAVAFAKEHPDIVKHLTALLEKYKKEGHSRPF